MQKIDDAETSIETAETHVPRLGWVGGRMRWRCSGPEVCRTARKGAVQHLKARGSVEPRSFSVCWLRSSPVPCQAVFTKAQNVMKSSLKVTAAWRAFWALNGPLFPLEYAKALQTTFSDHLHHLRERLNSFVIEYVFGDFALLVLFFPQERYSETPLKR